MWTICNAIHNVYVCKYLMNSPSSKGIYTGVLLNSSSTFHGWLVAANTVTNLDLFLCLCLVLLAAVDSDKAVHIEKKCYRHTVHMQLQL